MNQFDSISELVSNDLRVKVNKVDSALASNDGDRDSLDDSEENMNE